MVDIGKRARERFEKYQESKPERIQLALDKHQSMQTLLKENPIAFEKYVENMISADILFLTRTGESKETNLKEDQQTIERMIANATA